MGKNVKKGMTFIDLIEHCASPPKRGSTVGLRVEKDLRAIIAGLEKEDAKTLHDKLRNLGYTGIKFPDFNRLLDLFRANPKIKKATGETGY